MSKIILEMPDGSSEWRDESVIDWLMQRGFVPYRKNSLMSPDGQEYRFSAPNDLPSAFYTFA